MGNRKKFIESIKIVSEKFCRKIKGISDKFKGKELNGRAGANIPIILSTVLITANTVGCTANIANPQDLEHYDNYQPGTEYFQKEEIHSAYSYIASMLDEKEKLTNEEIIKISNMYKKIISTIDYIDNSADDEILFIIDELPEMEGLYTEMRKNLVDLMLKKSVIVMPSEADKYHKELLLDTYFGYTDQIPFQDIKIVQSDDIYYIFSEEGSEEGKVFLEIYLDKDEEGYLYITPNCPRECPEKIKGKGISLTNSEAQIPAIPVVNEVEEDLGR